MRRLAIVSDIHYAGPREHAHGRHYEFAGAKPSLAKTLATLYRDFIWMRDPLGNNHLLDRFCESVGEPELVIANGDYTCDVAGVGVSHDEALESVQLCLGKLRARFGDRLQTVIGDHELGKMALLGDHGGLRLESWQRATSACALRPFWQVEMGNFVLLGVTSTLIALPIFRRDALDSEWSEWEKFRAVHLMELRAAFGELKPTQRVVLFCHDPSALPFLWQEDFMRAKAGLIAKTVVGHLHTRILLWKTRVLGGLPPVRFLGASVHRMTTGLSQSRLWRHFNVVLCPALAGIQMLRGGGFLTMDLDEGGTRPPRVGFHPIPRKQRQ